MIARAAAPTTFIAETPDRHVADSPDTSFVDATNEASSSGCAAGAARASARRPGRMTVTSEPSNELSGIGGPADVSPADGATGCCTPQKEQNLAASTIELPQFRQSMSFSLVYRHADGVQRPVITLAPPADRRA
jgi:hypothetical protein